MAGRRIDWTELPDLALFTILQRLTDFAEFSAFAGVCRAWRSVAMESGGVRREFMASQPPLLCPIGFFERPLRFYSLAGNGRIYKNMLACLSRLVEDQERLRVSSVVNSGQHLIICGHLKTAPMIPRLLCSPNKLWLVNPFTGDEVVYDDLPPFPIKPTWVTLASQIEEGDHMLVASNFKTVVYWRPGDVEWTVYHCRTEDEMIKRTPVVASGGALYGLSDTGKVVMLEFIPHLKATVFEAKGESLPCYLLVESGGEILSLRRSDRNELVIHRFGGGSGEWVRVKNLNGRSLMLGSYGYASSDDPTRWGGKADCIYLLGRPGPNRKILVFHLGEGKIIETLPCEAPRDFGDMLFWLLPN